MRRARVSGASFDGKEPALQALAESLCWRLLPGQARITREVVPAEGRLGIGGVTGASGRRRVVITGWGR